jgi:hypothetical protein
MLLDDLFEALLLEVLKLVLLEVEADLRATSKGRVDRVERNGECTASS